MIFTGNIKEWNLPVGTLVTCINKPSDDYIVNKIYDISENFAIISEKNFPFEIVFSEFIISTKLHKILNGIKDYK